MSIVVTGATGFLGNQVIELLLKKLPANEIIASVRNVEKASGLVDRGVEVRYGDYLDLDSMKKSFKGASKILFVSSPDSDNTFRIRQHATVVQAARDAGVKHIAYTGYAFGEESQIPLATVHMATEYAIRSSDLPYTFLRNALYTDVFVNPGIAGSVAAGEVVTNAGNGKLNAVSREDLAKAAATVLLEDGHENKSYNLVNPQPWTFDELAEILSEVSGKNVVHRSVSYDEAKEYLKNVGLPEPIAELSAGIYHTIAHGETAKTSNDLTNLIGEPTPLKDLVKRALQG
ncbi:SDR family oxidoreductase [Halalkalibacter nanhaiisediminis]|uniref:NAD(P)H dehydrogenase (Quinone) n=1 Tax=Halalkalibacter nanhaiisediminis TaxID=688079 RepID=A0A562QSF2_9BACI|nr:SDR family oxidoreductase [Halalkalibacter nanhaiisediminis]TWI59110.1 NAD(P)H dehydrogenase (quinone) [Halalkalibacter nanhaiisediminis]